jgi:uncharacterized protein YpbB
VALSRCTSLDGLILHTPITAKQISTDPIVVQYSQRLQSEKQLEQELQQAVEEYEKEYFLKLFNFIKLQQAIDEWTLAVPSKKLPNLVQAIELSKTLKQKASELVEIADKTQQWIERNFNEFRVSGDREKLLNGLIRSVNHFNTLLHDEFFEKLQKHYASLKGKSKVKKYLNDVRDLASVISIKAKKIRQASWQNQVLFTGDSKIFETLEEVKVEKGRGSSGNETFALFQQGKSIPEIAEIRGLAVSTIETHLLEFVRSGKLKVEQMVNPEKIKAITDMMAKMEGAKSAELKAALGENYSFNEIRAVFFHLQQAQNHSTAD